MYKDLNLVLSYRMKNYMAALTWATILVQSSTSLCGAVCLPKSGGEAFSIGGDAIITELLPLHHGEHCDKVRRKRWVKSPN